MKDIDSILRDAFGHFQDRGVVSAYRWGSSIRNDYRPGISDFDNLVIVDDNPNLPTPKEFKEYVDTKYPGLFRFHVNYISLDEIEGQPPHNLLTKLFPVEYFLDQFHTWRYIAGKEFAENDFKIKKWGLDEIIKYQKGFSIKEFAEIESKYETGLHYLPVKSCIFLCHYLHKKTRGDHQYNYLTILDNMTSETKEILPLLMDLRSKNYPVEEVRKIIPQIIAFLEGIEVR